MRYLILGGGGFLGSHLSQTLLAAGHKVKIFDSPNARYLEIARQLGAEIVIGDFLNPRDLSKALIECDQIFHLVSMTVPQTSNDNPQFDVETNIIGTLRLLELLKNSEIQKVIFASSGGTVYGIPQKIPIKEFHPVNPISSYGITKLCIEKYLHMYWALFDVNYCVLRISNAYGDRQPVTKSQGVISSFLEKTIQNKEIVVWGDGSNIRDYIYVGDIAKAFMAASVYNGDLRVFNIGSGRGHSLVDIINIIEQVTGQKIRVRYAPDRSLDVPINILNNERAKLHLKWQPEIELLDGVSKTLEYMRREIEIE